MPLPLPGNAVDASATFTTSADQITVVLNNLLVNQKDVGQNISDLFFTVSTGQNSGSIDQAMSSGLERTVNADQTFTDGALVSPDHWELQTSGGQLLLNDLTAGQPIQTILGARRDWCLQQCEPLDRRERTTQPVPVRAGDVRPRRGGRHRRLDDHRGGLLVRHGSRSKRSRCAVRSRAGLDYDRGHRVRLDGRDGLLRRRRTGSSVA